MTKSMWSSLEAACAAYRAIWVVYFSYLLTYLQHIIVKPEGYKSDYSKQYWWKDAHCLILTDWWPMKLTGKDPHRSEHYNNKNKEESSGMSQCHYWRVMPTNLWCKSLQLCDPVRNSRQWCTDEKRSFNAIRHKMTDQSYTLDGLAKTHLISQNSINSILIQHLSTQNVQTTFNIQTDRSVLHR